MTNSYEGMRNTSSEHYNDHVNEPASKVQSISIEESYADVTIKATDEEDISVHFHRRVSAEDGSVGLTLTCKNGLLTVRLKQTNTSTKKQLALEIHVPKDKVLENCIIRTSKDVFVDEGINANYISAISNYGNITIRSQFEKASLNAQENIDVTTRAEQNLSLEVISKQGNIHLHLNNIANILYNNLGIGSPYSHLVDHHRPTPGGCVAEVQYSISTGTITTE